MGNEDAQDKVVEVSKSTSDSCGVARSEAAEGMEDLANSSIEYNQARKNGMRDRQTRQILGQQPVFFDSAEEASTAKQAEQSQNDSQGGGLQAVMHNIENTVGGVLSQVTQGEQNIANTLGGVLTQVEQGVENTLGKVGSGLGGLIQGAENLLSGSSTDKANQPGGILGGIENLLGIHPADSAPQQAAPSDAVVQSNDQIQVSALAGNGALSGLENLVSTTPSSSGTAVDAETIGREIQTDSQRNIEIMAETQNRIFEIEQDVLKSVSDPNKRKPDTKIPPTPKRS